MGNKVKKSVAKGFVKPDNPAVNLGRIAHRIPLIPLIFPVRKI
tara:strand:+ start:220 stop:348 length:129 start_codon:yes stop_codon:yes gene_type:complete